MARINVYVPNQLAADFDRLCPDLFPSHLLQEAMKQEVMLRTSHLDLDTYMSDLYCQLDHKKEDDAK